MAKQVKWTVRAKDSKQDILTYWTQRNKSNTFSKKLNKLIKDATKIIGEFPHSGKTTNRENIRIKIIRNYLVFYKENESEVIILLVWDGRRNPGDLEKHLH